MPKVKKGIRSAAMAAGVVRHNPLGQVLQEDSDRNKYAPLSSRRQKQKRQSDDNDDNGTTTTDDVDDVLDEKSSRRILELSRAQQLEVEAEEEGAASRRRRSRNNNKSNNKSKKNDDVAAFDHDISSDEEEEDGDNYHNDHDDYDDDDYIEHDDQGYVTVVDGTEGLSAEDEALVASMMMNTSNNDGDTTCPRRTLADVILEKIEEKEVEKRGEIGEGEGEADHQEDMMSLPPKVVQVYTDIGKILSRYTSGKLPKAFKVIPSLSNWEEVLYLTRPDTWTPQACYQATRIFASNLNPRMAQRYYNLVLLDAVRNDIHANKKLNYHYYMSLKKAVYKPAAFFKGILLPLCRENCTLREAAIVASVLQRVSIPVHHSAVAIHKLAQQTEYTGATSIFLKTLLNKKYSLPAPVIGSLVRHYASFLDYKMATTLPVLWHQSLLVFVQRYKNEIQDESREALRLLMKKHYHHKITPEIRRELFGQKAWKDERSSMTMTNTTTTKQHVDNNNSNRNADDDAAADNMMSMEM